jgi:uncharacterized protein YecT (DUF1311 family)
MRISLLTVAMILVTSTFAFAQSNCTNASDQATLNECASKSYEKSDAELNKLYKEIEGRLKDDADTKKLLVSAQKAWLGFRNAECGFAASVNAGGSIYPMVVAACNDQLTRSRIKDFKTYLNCKQEDTGCPVPAAN